MTGGLIQLVAYGEQDLFLTEDPQITFFKIMYRRHTNFSIEQIQQTFSHTPNFGGRVSCILAKSGDLITNIVLSITLPEIPQIFNTNGSIDNLTKFAWIRKIGFGIIKEIDVEIGGQTIDKHYGKWLNIWSELNGSRWEDINKAIGNVSELFSYSSKKQAYQLFIPMQFWFCRSSSLALPIMCLQYNDVKINLELADASSCYNITPTNYILIQNDIVNFTPYEYIYQTVNNNVAYGMFTSFDPLTGRLYYTQISNNPFLAINDQNFYNYSESKQQEILDQYAITGYSSNYSASAYISASQKFSSATTVNSVSYTFNTLSDIRITSCFLLVNYIFLDDEERIKFYKSEHEYLIEQLIYTGASTLDGVNRNVKVGIINPCKYIVWTTQLSYLSDTNINDIFNYTDSYIYDKNNQQIGNSIILNASILLNSRERFSKQDDLYFNCVQPLQYFNRAPSKGICVYSFCITPEQIQPSGSCNMSKIDNIQINLRLSPQVSTTNTVIFECYALTSNIFKISSGIGGIVFTN